VLNGQEYAFYIDGKHFIEQVCLRAFEASHPRFNTRVVDEVVQAAVAIHGGDQQPLHVAFLADIGGNKQRVAAQLCGGSFAALLVTAGNEDGSPSGNQCLSNSPADASGTTFTMATFCEVVDMRF
jgi:hypothetical protein